MTADREDEWSSPFTAETPRTGSARAAFGRARGPSTFLPLPWAAPPLTGEGESPFTDESYSMDDAGGHHEALDTEDEDLEWTGELQNEAEIELESLTGEPAREFADERSDAYTDTEWNDVAREADEAWEVEDELESEAMANEVQLEDEIDVLSDHEDDVDLERYSTDPDFAGETGGPLAAGQETIARVPLLRRHAGIGPDLIVTWNAMPAAPSVIDVVIHLHGYALSKGARLHIRNDLLPRSGLDWSDPSGRDATTGRARPTLALLPRGHFFGGKSGRAYSFPALDSRKGLQALIDLGLATLASRLGVGGLSAGRLILTAHSGGGAALMRILAQRDQLDVHEVHVFDALYGDASALIRWLKPRLERDLAALANIAEPVERYMATRGGALRVLYRSGTAPQSRKVAAAIAAVLPADSRLHRWYRAERTDAGHVEIPKLFGWRLLADAGADLPGVPHVPAATTRKAAASKEAWDGEAWDKEGGDQELEPEYEGGVSPAASGPPPAGRLSWPNATEEQLDFMRRVYKARIERSAGQASFVPEPDGPMENVENGETMQAAAARRCVAMLSAARVALAAEKGAGDVKASAVKRFGAKSGYRSVDEQFSGWQGAFRSKYYRDTVTARGKKPGGAHGQAAVDFMVGYVGKRIAAPGYSRHNDGLAMDFFTCEGKECLYPSTNKANVAAWKTTWLFAWLSKHANAYSFYQNTSIDEPWHWEYRGSLAVDQPSASSAVSAAAPTIVAAPSATAGRGGSLATLASLPARLADAVRQGAITIPIALAIVSGQRDEGTLTNMLFHSRHPELGAGYKIKPDQKDLVRSWLDLRDRIVRPLLRALTTGS